MRVPKKQRGVIEVGINPRSLTYCAGRPIVLLGPSWLAFAAFYQLIVFQVVAALAKLFLAALAPALPLLQNLCTSKTYMMRSAKDSDKVRKKEAFYNWALPVKSAIVVPAFFTPHSFSVTFFFPLWLSPFFILLQIKPFVHRTDSLVSFAFTSRFLDL